MGLPEERHVPTIVRKIKDLQSSFRGCHFDDKQAEQITEAFRELLTTYTLTLDIRKKRQCRDARSLSTPPSTSS